MLKDLLTTTLRFAAFSENIQLLASPSNNCTKQFYESDWNAVSFWTAGEFCLEKLLNRWVQFRNPHLYARSTDRNPLILVRLTVKTFIANFVLSSWMKSVQCHVKLKWCCPGIANAFLTPHLWQKPVSFYWGTAFDLQGIFRSKRAILVEMLTKTVT